MKDSLELNNVLERISDYMKRQNTINENLDHKLFMLEAEVECLKGKERVTALVIYALLIGGLLFVTKFFFIH